MKRPNPWIVVPAIIAAAVGGFVGFFVTDASCAPASCAFSAALVAVGSALATGVGVGVVAVLAARSIAEWRDHADREVLISLDDPDPPAR